MSVKGKSACKQWLDDRVGHQSDDCLIWPFSTARGYGHFAVNRKLVYAHRYMCELVNGEPPTPAYQASHSCGNGHKGCVHPRHLSWKTQSENQLDRRLHGTANRNTYGRLGKLSSGQVERMRSLAGTKTHDELAELFNTSRTNVQLIVSGKTKLRPFGLERQRVRNVLAKANKPLSGPQITVAANLASTRAATSMLYRMVQDGEAVRASYGFYVAPHSLP